MGISRRSILKGSSLIPLAAVAAGANAQTGGVKNDLGFTHAADVVVVGYGAAGAAAAITAADEGASVFLIERQPVATLRSNTRMSGGFIHCPDPAGNKKALKSYFVGLFSGQYSPVPSVGENNALSEEMASAWTEYTPKLVDWLQKLDPELKLLPTGGKAQYINFPGAEDCSYRVFRTSYTDKIDNKDPVYNKPKAEATEGEALFRALENAINARKEKITVLDKTRAKKLITNERGDVIGLVCDGSDGKEIRVQAKKGVALCCGGYEYSPEMRRAFLPGLGVGGYAFYGTLYNEGDGIRMGLEAGAGMEKAGAVAGRLVWAVPVRYKGMKIGLTTNGIGRGHSLVVNSFGKRFCNEHDITGGITSNAFFEEASRQNLKTLTYDNHPSWLIFDDHLRRGICLANTVRSTVGYGFVDYGAKDNSDAVRKGWILKGDTVEDLARAISSDPENGHRMKADVLAATVQKFNADCEKGEDSEFNRPKVSMQAVSEGPFYAIPLYAGGSNTKGGLLTNGKKQVLDWFGNPIRGLYAAGEIACGLNRGGGMLTECLVFGQVVGREIS